MRIIGSAPVLIISTGVEIACIQRAHTTALGYQFTFPKGLGFQPDFFATVGYSPISVSTVIRPPLSHGGKRKLKQLEQNRKRFVTEG